MITALAALAGACVSAGCAGVGRIKAANCGWGRTPPPYQQLRVGVEAIKYPSDKCNYLRLKFDVQIRLSWIDAPTKPMATSTYKHGSGKTSDTGSAPAKLGGHHLAYLRAIAEGLPRQQAASRYLGLDPQDGAVALRKAHASIVDRMRALARRCGDPRWRLVGVVIRPHEPGTQPPSMDDWADALGWVSLAMPSCCSSTRRHFQPTARLCATAAYAPSN